MTGFWAWLFGVKGKRKSPIDWLEVEFRQREIELLQKQGQSGYRQSIIEFDKLIDSVMKQIVEDSTFAERLKSLRSHFERGCYQALWKAHIKRNELVHDSGSFVADWELMEFMRNYREALSQLRSIAARIRK